MKRIIFVDHTKTYGEHRAYIGSGQYTQVVTVYDGIEHEELEVYCNKKTQIYKDYYDRKQSYYIISDSSRANRYSYDEKIIWCDARKMSIEKFEKFKEENPEFFI